MLVLFMSVTSMHKTWCRIERIHFRLTMKCREAALRKEMEASLERVQATPGKEPGTGNIRGIGAERRVERVETEAGTMECKSYSFFLCY